MRCLTYAIRQLTEHGGYINIRPSFRDDGSINPWIFHVLWSEDIAGVRHLTTDDHKRHWFKEFLCCLTGQHYVESSDDLHYIYKHQGMVKMEIPIFSTLITLVAFMAILFGQAYARYLISKVRKGARGKMERRSWISFLMVVLVVGLSGCAGQNSIDKTNQMIADSNAGKIEAFASAMSTCNEQPGCLVGVSMAFAGNMGQQQFIRPEGWLDYLREARLWLDPIDRIVARLDGSGGVSGDRAGSYIKGDGNLVLIGNKASATDQSQASFSLNPSFVRSWDGYNRNYTGQQPISDSGLGEVAASGGVQ